jgi:hypothetical protein
MIKYITEYFLHRDELFDGDLESIKNILENNIFIYESDLNSVQYVLRNYDELDELMKGEGKVTDNTLSDYFDLDQSIFTIDNLNFHTEAATTNIKLSDFKMSTKNVDLNGTPGVQYNWKDSKGNLVAKFTTFKWWDGKNIEDLAVSNNYKKKGLSYQLLDYATKELNCKHLAVDKDNKIAKHVYDKYGFKIADQDNNRYYMELETKKSISKTEQVNFVNDVLKESRLQDNEIRKLINAYKKEQKKSPEGLTAVIKKIYTKSPANIIEETPNLLSWIRTFFVFGTFAINPILGIITIMTDYFIKMNLNRDEAEKILKFYKAEKTKCENKLSRLNSDESKDRCKSYIKRLEDSIDKIESYRDELYSENELNKMRQIDESANISEYEKITIDEYICNYQPKFINQITLITAKLPTIVKQYPSISNKLNICIFDDLLDIRNSIYGYIDDNDMNTVLLVVFPVNNATELSGMYNDVSALCNRIQSLLNSNDIIVTFNRTESSYYINVTHMIPLILSADEEKIRESSMNLYIKNLCTEILFLSESVEELERLYPQNLMDDFRKSVDWITPDNLMLTTQLLTLLAPEIINKTELIDFLKESKSVINDYIIGSAINESIMLMSKPHINTFPILHEVYIERELIKNLRIGMLEGVNLNSLKLAGEALKKKVQNLSTKEQEVSRNVDVSLSQFRKSMEKALTTDKREAIIKGSIIPSFSKMMKIGLVAGTGFLINPVMAAIAAIGALAISRHLTEKERKLLLDEIDIELKVIDKEIQNVESKGNMKEYKYLLKYQRKLEREKQRIKYNLKVHSQEVPDDSKRGDD